MSRLVKKGPRVLAARKRRASRASSSFKDALVAELELKQTVSQLRIEQLERLREQSADQNKRLENFFHRIPIGYVTLSDKGMILDWNVAAAELLNLNTQDSPSIPFAFFPVREDVPIFLNHLRRCKRMLDDRPVVSELKLKPGRVSISVQLVSVASRNGKDLVFQTAIIDLTERKKK